MANPLAVGQDSNFTPPEGPTIAGAPGNQPLVITLDNTSRVYDLGDPNLLFGGHPIEAGGVFFVSMRADVKWWYRLDSQAAGAVDETAAVAAGGTPAFIANACIEASPGEWVHFRVRRIRHRYLVIKGSVAGKVRIFVSSDVNELRGN